MSEINLEITAAGGIQMLHDDRVDLSVFGKIETKRASHVEFSNEFQEWYCASAKTGDVLHWAKTRSAALDWERKHFSPSGAGWKELTG